MFILTLLPLACLLLSIWIDFPAFWGVMTHLFHFFHVFLSLCISYLSPIVFSNLVFHSMKLFLRSFFWYIWQGSEGYSPLLVACKFNKTDLVRYLLGFPEVDSTLTTSVSSEACIPEFFYGFISRSLSNNLGRAWASPTLAWLHCARVCVCLLDRPLGNFKWANSNVLRRSTSWPEAFEGQLV